MGEIARMQSLFRCFKIKEEFTMAMVVKNNMTAINTLNTLNKNSSALSKSLQKVSSGMKINSAADDASGYAISERMRVQIRSLDQANQNTQNGSSMMKVAEGAVSSTVEILKTLKEKAVNAANDSNTDSDRQTIQKELDQSIDQINDNANVTFNGKYLVDGSKNTIGNATYTALSNQSLKEGTTGETKLTELAARSADSLEIRDTDKVTVSYVQAGKTYTTTFQVGYKDDAGKDQVHTLQDIFNAAEDVDKTSTIFANGSNDSILAAQGKTADEITDIKNDTATAIGHKKDYDDAVTDEEKKAKALSDSIASLKAAVEKFNATAGLADDEKLKDIDWESGDDFDKLASFSKAMAGATTADKFSKDTAGGKTAFDAVKTALSAYNGVTLTATATAQTKTAFDVRTGGATQITDQKKAAYTDADKKLAQAKLLTGKTVGLAASNDTVDTASGKDAITITANTAGIGGQISGFNISISDSKGNVKKSANAALDAFEETIRAQNKSDDNAISLQVGAKANQSIKVGLTDMRAEALGLQGSDGTKLNISTQDKANAAINVLDNAIQKALDQQTTIGSVESRLEYTSTNLTTASENVQASESAIRDADMAKEMTNYTKNNVLLQAAQSMLAQANQSSSNVLSLLQ